MTEGRRINPATGEAVEAPEAEHFYRCDCGAQVDMRDLAMVIRHTGPHHPQDLPQ